MISLRIEGGTETYLSPPHIQDLAPDGCRLPTTGKCAGSPLLGRSTRVDWSGCAVTFFPPALALARVADVLASVASWDASFSIVSRNLSVKRSSVASFPGEKASGIDKMKSKAGSTNATTARLLYWVMWWTAFPHCCKTDYIESLACASAPPPSSREHTLVYRFKSGGAISIIFSWVWISASFDGFTAFTRSLSFACLSMIPSNLGSLIEKAGSSDRISLRLLSTRLSASQSSARF